MKEEKRISAAFLWSSLPGSCNCSEPLGKGPDWKGNGVTELRNNFH